MNREPGIQVAFGFQLSIRSPGKMSELENVGTGAVIEVQAASSAVEATTAGDSATKAVVVEPTSVKTKSTECKEMQIVGKVVEVPLFKSLVASFASLYKSTKRTNFVTKASFAVAELSFWTAWETAKLAYKAVPTTGTVGKLKQDLERVVSLADNWACYGLDVLQSNFPSLMNKTFGKTKPRRSARRRQKVHPGTGVPLVTFPISPERKRKRSDADSVEETFIEELLRVNESYISDDDPDYKPNDDEDESESDDSEGSGEGDSGEGEDEEDAEATGESGGQSLTVEEVGKKGLKLKCNTEWTIVNAGDGDSPREEEAKKGQDEGNSKGRCQAPLLTSPKGKKEKGEVRGGLDPGAGSCAVGTSSLKDKKTYAKAMKDTSPRKTEDAKKDQQATGEAKKVPVSPKGGKGQEKIDTGKTEPLKGRIIV